MLQLPSVLPTGPPFELAFLVSQGAVGAGCARQEEGGGCLVFVLSETGPTRTASVFIQAGTGKDIVVCIAEF